MIKKVYNLYLSKDKELAGEIRSILGFTPKNIGLFKRAFYHKSMNNMTQNVHNNERLEYLGDAVLSTIVAEYLFKKYPTQKEGFLTKMRSKIVKRKTLNDIADKMGLDIILSKYSMGRLSSSMKGNALEALVGAIYIEFGYQRTKKYIVKHVLQKYLDIHTLETLDDNYKSQLLEWGQKYGKSVEFKLLNKYKSEKRDKFKIGVYIEGKEKSIAEDYNKKSAEQKAASEALTQIKD